MTLLLVLAGLLLVLSAALFFGPQLAVYGMDGLRDALKRPEAQLIAGTLVSILALLLFAPLTGSALISGGQTGQVVGDSMQGLRLA
ncbi:hypothetical protein [Henriciella aquimarina]|uniref:hypothetical protein n=1 Tax=Henriciella aquimarina TaxID=545261 RepID=UPI0009FE57F5|nr:hypothetical protein [Henriciella aquimarina]